MGVYFLVHVICAYLILLIWCAYCRSLFFRLLVRGGFGVLRVPSCPCDVCVGVRVVTCCGHVDCGLFTFVVGVFVLACIWYIPFRVYAFVF